MSSPGLPGTNPAQPTPQGSLSGVKLVPNQLKNQNKRGVFRTWSLGLVLFPSHFAFLCMTFGGEIRTQEYFVKR